MADPIQFEAIKTGLKQSKDGYMLSLAVHPDELHNDLMRDFVGSRYVVVMVRLGDDEKQSDVYWLAWEGLRLSGVTVKPFGSDFLDTLKSVEVAESDPLA